MLYLTKYFVQKIVIMILSYDVAFIQWKLYDHTCENGAYMQCH